MQTVIVSIIVIGLVAGAIAVFAGLMRQQANVYEAKITTIKDEYEKELAMAARVHTDTHVRLAGVHNDLDAAYRRIESLERTIIVLMERHEQALVR